MKEEKGLEFWDIAKIVLVTAGAIYLVSLVTWLAHWGVMAAAVGGVAYLAWHISSAFNSKPKPVKMIAADTPFDTRMKQLRAEERELDRKIGL